MGHFKKIMKDYSLNNVSSNKLFEAIEGLDYIFDYVEDTDKHVFWKAMKDMHENLYGTHFNETYAVYKVSQMYHTKTNGNVCKGEKYTIEEAKNIFNKHVASLGKGYTCWDVYVAINAQYHDYINLFKEWYKNDTEESILDKLVKTAIEFWFKDEDYNGCKIWNYFKTCD